MFNKKGIALFLTLNITAVALLIAITYVSLSTNELSFARKINDSVKARYMAEAGLARKLMELETGAESNIDTTAMSFPDGSPSGGYYVSVNKISAQPLPEYVITSTGAYASRGNRDVKWRIEMRVRGRSCAHYACLSDTENLTSGVTNWYITGSYMEGAIHTNQHLHIAGRPIFNGPVTQSEIVLPNGYEGNPDTVNNPDFRKGFSFGVPGIVLSSSYDPSVFYGSFWWRSWGKGSNLFETNTVITFLSDGTLRIIYYEDYPWGRGGWGRHQYDYIVPMPLDHLILVCGGTASISGVVNGQVTVVSDRDIIITNNLTYCSDPRTNPDCCDMLGIITLGNVVLDSSAPNDVSINACIVAPNGAFCSSLPLNAPARGTVTFIGGVTSKYEGALGQFDSSGALVSGYRTVRYCDTRMDTLFNPFYFGILKNSYGFSLFTKIYRKELKEPS